MNRDAFEQQARSWRQKALCVSMSYGAGRDEAEDIAQDVMLRLWQMHKRLILINANQDEILSRVFLIPDLETSTITVDPGNYLFHIETTEEDRFYIEKTLQTLLINPVSGQFSEVYVPRITKTRKEKTKRVWMPLKESPPDEDPIIID